MQDHIGTVVFLLAAFCGAARAQCTNGLIYDCHLKYPKENPTLCLNPRACYNRTGVEHWQYYTDKDEFFRDQMLQLHNGARLTVLRGSMNSDMLELTWSEELSRGALNYLMKLCVDYDTSGKGPWVYDAPPAKCGDTYNFKPVGQNLQAEFASDVSDPRKIGRFVFSQWTAAFLDSNFFPINALPGEAEFAQVLWSRSYKVGCAYITAYNGYMACNYAHAGAIPGEYIYNLTSGCPPGSIRGGNTLCQLSDEKLLRASLNITSI